MAAKFLRTAACCSALLAAMTSCDHKDLCYTHPHNSNVTIHFDWSGYPGQRPATMSVYAYPQGGGEAIRYDLDADEGGEITLPLATYDILCVNPAGDYTRLRGEDAHTTLEAYTREGSPLEHLGRSSSAGAPRAEGAEDEDVFVTPDFLFHDMQRDIAIDNPQGDYSVTFTPEDLLCNYSFEINNVENLKYVSMTCGTLSGMAPSMLVTTQKLNSTPATVPFPATSDAVSRITGRFRTFGHCSDDLTARHILMIYNVLADGSGHYSQVDVTDQVHNATDPKNVHIIVNDGMSLPKPLDEEGGFHPTVNDWEEVIIPIPL